MQRGCVADTRPIQSQQAAGPTPAHALPSSHHQPSALLQAGCTQQYHNIAQRQRLTLSKKASPVWCAMRWNATCSLAPSGPGTRSQARLWLQ